MPRMTFLPRLGALPLVIILLTACAAPTTPAPGAADQAPRVNAPKRITAAVRADPPTLNSELNTIIPGATALERLVSSALGTDDDEGNLHPQLGEAIPSVENGLWVLLPDGRMQTTSRIRAGARWHDGTPVTADDLVFTAMVGKDRELAVLGHAGLANVESVEARGAATAVVTWNRTFIEADKLFTHGFALPLPRHLLERVYLEEKAAFAEQPYWNHDFVGTGPFKLKEWSKSSHVLLTANEDYVLGRPKIDDIEVKFFSDGATLFANVLAGSVDITIGERNFSLDEALSVRDQWRDGRLAPGDRSVVVSFPQLLNPTPAILGEVQMRRALLHAIDRQELVNTFQAGLTEVAHGYLSPDIREYREIQPAIVRYEYDPRRAAELIEGLGYVRGADGAFADRAGRRLAIEIRSTTLSENNRAMLSVADYWTRVGVAAEPHTVPLARSQDAEYRAGFPGFELIRQGNGTNIIANLHSSKARLPQNNFRTTGGFNYPRYLDPNHDAQIDRYTTTVPWTERMEVLRQIVRHLTDQVIVMGLFYSTEANLVSNRLENVSARRAWNAHEWTAK
jgi:peptide/nickel transport system substrate-binding protein